MIQTALVLAALACQTSDVEIETSGAIGPMWTDVWGSSGPTDDRVRDVVLSPDDAVVYAICTDDEAWFAIARDASNGTELWRTTVSGPAEGPDDPRQLTISPDGATLIACGRMAESSWRDDAAAMAFDAHSGALLWTHIESDPTGTTSYFEDLVCHPDSSTVYVVGSVAALPRVVAFDTRTGAVRFELVPDMADAEVIDLRTVAIDPAGATVFAAGSLARASTSEGGYVVFALDAQDGSERWSGEFAAASGSQGLATDCAVSPDGTTLVVTGSRHTFVNNQKGPWATVSISAASGVQRWTRETPASGLVRFASGGARVVVGARARQSIFAEPTDSYAVAALDGANGAILWTDTAPFPGGAAVHVRDIATSPTGLRTYVLATAGYPGTVQLRSIVTTTGAIASDTQWTSSLPAPTQAVALALTSDAARAFVGADHRLGQPEGWSDGTLLALEGDFATERWALDHEMLGPCDDRVTEIVVDDVARRTYVAGFTLECGSESSVGRLRAFDALSGDLLFEIDEHGANGAMVVRSLVVDSAAGVLYAACDGGSFGTNQSLVVLALDGATGAELWRTVIQSPSGYGGPVAKKLILSPDRTVLYAVHANSAFIVGAGGGLGIVALSASAGAVQWQHNSSNGESIFDAAISPDGSRMCIVGRVQAFQFSGFFSVFCIDLASGQLAWMDSKTLLYGSVAVSVAIDATGRVFVAGSGPTALGTPAALIACYDLATGVELWWRERADPFAQNTAAAGLLFDATDQRIYVGGTSSKTSGGPTSATSQGGTSATIIPTGTWVEYAWIEALDPVDGATIFGSEDVPAVGPEGLVATRFVKFVRDDEQGPFAVLIDRVPTAGSGADVELRRVDRTNGATLASARTGTVGYSSAVDVDLSPDGRLATFGVWAAGTGRVDFAVSTFSFGGASLHGPDSVDIGTDLVLEARGEPGSLSVVLLGIPTPPLFVDDLGPVHLGPPFHQLSPILVHATGSSAIPFAVAVPNAPHLAGLELRMQGLNVTLAPTYRAATSNALDVVIQ